MATEKRLIDANEMKNNIIEAMMRQFEKNGDQIALRLAEMMCHFIDVTDTVDAVEVVHGRWIDIYDGIYANPIYKCSVCGNSAPIEERYPVIGRMYTDWSFTPYCPNCGAKMDGDGK